MMELSYIFLGAAIVFLTYRVVRLQVLVDSSIVIQDGISLLLDRQKFVFSKMDEFQHKLEGCQKKLNTTESLTKTFKCNHEEQLKAIHDHLQLLYQKLEKPKKS